MRVTNFDGESEFNVEVEGNTVKINAGEKTCMMFSQIEMSLRGGGADKYYDVNLFDAFKFDDNKYKNIESEEELYRIIGEEMFESFVEQIGEELGR